MHLLSYLAVSAALATDVLANHILHEKREVAPPQWKKRSMMDKEAVIPLRIALQQSNLHLAEKYLYEVSHPKSEKYGQHWDSKKVAEAFAPR
jgi:tripeptidyl-peptidase-1